VVSSSTGVSWADELQYFGFYGPYNGYFDGADPATTHTNLFHADNVSQQNKATQMANRRSS